MVFFSLISFIRVNPSGVNGAVVVLLTGALNDFGPSNDDLILSFISFLTARSRIRSRISFQVNERPTAEALSSASESDDSLESDSYVSSESESLKFTCFLMNGESNGAAWILH